MISPEFRRFCSGVLIVTNPNRPRGVRPWTKRHAIFTHASSVAAVLVSDEARCITATIIPVDGGQQLMARYQPALMTTVAIAVLPHNKLSPWVEKTVHRETGGKEIVSRSSAATEECDASFSCPPRLVVNQGGCKTRSIVSG
jgi:hypothetical protein